MQGWVRDALKADSETSDREGAVPHAVWDEAVAHCDERGLASRPLSVATTNVFNRLAVARAA